jgi:hypothetical protein
MRRDLIKPDLRSSFLSCEKDAQIILRKLFVESQPHSNDLKRLMIINTPNCLSEDNVAYNSVTHFNLKDLKDRGYIKLEPKLNFGEHEDVKSYMLLSFDNFSPNATNPEYRDCTVGFDIICHTDYWDIGDYQMRPVKIMGIIDGILNETKLTGIGKLHFMGANQLILDENFSGYTLMYRAVHDVDGDDKIPLEE